VPKIEFDGVVCESNPNETVLDCLTRYNCPPPSSCRSGLCHTCMMRAEEGTPPDSAQVGLKDTLVKQNYFLACSCVPSEDLKVTLADEAAAPKFEMTLQEKSLLTPVILRLRFTVPDELNYSAGQFVNFFKDDSLTRSYSIASVPELDDYLEFHIEKISNGKMSGWLFDELNVGDSLKVSEPLGECYYRIGNPATNMLMVATGSGLAPIYGILRDALRKGHSGDIHVYHGSANSEKLYLVDELKKLTTDHDNFHYSPCLSRDEKPGFAAGRANELALAEHKDLKGWRIYLCGHPQMVNDTKRNAFLNGASLSDIYSDPFEFAS